MASKPGIYDMVTPSLPALPPKDPSYQAKVDAEKGKLPPLPLSELAHRYAQARIDKEELEATLYAVNLRVAVLEQLLIKSQENHEEGWGLYGAKSNMLRLPDGSKIAVQKEPYGKVVDKEAFRQWCIANGYEPQLQLWPSTMNEIVKERLLTGAGEPDGTVAYSYTKVVFTPTK